MFTILVIFFLGICGSRSEESSFKYVTSYNKDGRVLNAEDIEKTTVNVLKPITFLIHSHLDNASSFQHLKDSYLERQVHNVFLVDSQDGAAIASFISTIFAKTGEAYLTVHLVGVAKGSETAAAAAALLRSQTGKKISRITALEPPSSFSRGGDAVFVDVVHALGAADEAGAQGDATFYVDDAGCRRVRDFGELAATEVFAKSINSGEFKGVKCESAEDFRAGKCEKNEKVTFGEDADPGTRGRFFLAAC